MTDHLLDPLDPEQPRITMEHAVGPRPSNGALPTYGGDEGLSDREIHLLDYVKILYKRRWTAVTAFLMLFATVMLYNFTATPIFEAKAQLLIEKENSNVVSFKEAFEQNQTADDYYQTQYKILQSRALAKRTIDALNLWNHPLIVGTGRPGGLASIIRAPFEWARNLSGSAAPSVTPGVSENAAQSRAIDVFLSGLTVASVRGSRLVDLRYESPDPAYAASAANALAKAYIEQNLEFKFLASKDASDWLGARLAEQRKQVEASEQALQRYREQTDNVSLEERQNIVVQKLGDLNAAVTRAKTERIQREAIYNQLSSIQADNAALDTFPAVLSNGFIQQQKAEIADLQRQQAQLADKLGPNHPDMQRISRAMHQVEARLQGEIAKVVQSVKNEFQAAAIQERNLTAALEQQKQEIMALNRRSIDYGALQRDAVTNRQIFESLLQRTKETGISGELKTSNIRIVDPAEVPRRPVRPARTTNMMLASAGGIGLALALVFFFEYIDNRIKSPLELKSHLGLPFLGLVPALFGELTRHPLICNGVPSNFSEAFRAIRTNVLFSSAEEGSKSLIVTSTGPGEGKTVVAANLAIALAQSGHRVVLIDGDMRKPRMHQIFEQGKEPGLSNLLVGTAKASEVVRPSGVQGLWILPAGLHPPNPSELLGSRRFRDFIASLGQHFDWIIVDSPPVMAVADASVIAHHVSGLVFVVGAEMTSRHSAQRAIEQLEQARAGFVGAILNRVDLKHNAYYYSQYYRREYGEYYQSESV